MYTTILPQTFFLNWQKSFKLVTQTKPIKNIGLQEYNSRTVTSYHNNKETLPGCDICVHVYVCDTQEPINKPVEF